MTLSIISLFVFLTIIISSLIIHHTVNKRLKLVRGDVFLTYFFVMIGSIILGLVLYNLYYFTFILNKFDLNSFVFYIIFIISHLTLFFVDLSDRTQRINNIIYTIIFSVISIIVWYLLTI